MTAELIPLRTRPTDFTLGERVMFENGRKGSVYGTVKRINAKTVTLDQCSDNPKGWRVHPYSLHPADSSDPGVTDWNAPAGQRPWRKGDRVEFNFRGSKVVVGTIDKANSKTCSITPDNPDRPGQYYRIPPTHLRPATGTAPTPAAPPDTTDADKALWERYAQMYGFKASDFGKTFTSRGTDYRIAGLNLNSPKYKVKVVRVRDGKSFKFTLGGAQTGLAQALAANKPVPKPRRAEFTILDDITGCFSRLSPENLLCDGELSVSQGRSKAAAIRRELRTLFVEYGNTLTESETWILFEQAVEAA